MTTLHEKKIADAFAMKCYQLWKNWNNIYTPKAENRLKKIKDAFKNIIKKDNFTYPTNIIIADLGNNTNGQFSPRDWQISINRNKFNKDNLKCIDFVKLCETVYHETRHAEQFYRIMQEMSKGFNLFKSIPANKIKTKLGTPYKVALHACNNQSGYKIFLKSTLIQYTTFDVKTILRTRHTDKKVVRTYNEDWEERIKIWIEQTCPKGGHNLERFGQNSNTGAADILYWNKSQMEKDARECQELLSKSLKGKIPKYDKIKNWERTNGLMNSYFL